MSQSHSPRFLLLITCLAALGFLLMTPSGVNAEVKRPPLTTNEKVQNAEKYCEGMGGMFSVRGTADRAITECQASDGGYTTCLITPTGHSCHSLEVDGRPVDEGNPFPVDLPDDATQGAFTPPMEDRQRLR